MKYRTNTTIWVEMGDNTFGWGKSGTVYKIDPRRSGWKDKKWGKDSIKMTA